MTRIARTFLNAAAALGLTCAAAQAETINVSTWAHGAPLQEAVIATRA